MKLIHNKAENLQVYDKFYFVDENFFGSVDSEELDSVSFRVVARDTDMKMSGGVVLTLVGVPAGWDMDDDFHYIVVSTPARTPVYIELPEPADNIQTATTSGEIVPMLIAMMLNGADMSAIDPLSINYKHFIEYLDLLQADFEDLDVCIYDVEDLIDDDEEDFYDYDPDS